MRFHFIPLEERIVLDAAGAAGVVDSYALEHHVAEHSPASVGPTDSATSTSQDGSDSTQDSKASSNESQSNTGQKPLSSTDSDIAKDGFHPLVDAAIPVADVANRVLLISSDIYDAQTLASDALSNVKVIVYDPNMSLINLGKMISNILGNEKVDSIAFASHGQAGQFDLVSGTTVSLDTLQSNQALESFWQGISQNLNDHGRVDLLSCDLASTAVGLELVSRLDQILLSSSNGKDITVAASTDATGSSTLEGNWNLEMGGIDAGKLYFDTAALAGWDSLLPSTSINNPTFLKANADDFFVTAGTTLKFSDGALIANDFKPLGTPTISNIQMGDPAAFKGSIGRSLGENYYYSVSLNDINNGKVPLKEVLTYTEQYTVSGVTYISDSSITIHTIVPKTDVLTTNEFTQVNQSSYSPLVFDVRTNDVLSTTNAIGALVPSDPALLNNLMNGTIHFTQAQHGTITLAAGGQLSYTPNFGFTGVDTFTYYFTGYFDPTHLTSDNSTHLSTWQTSVITDSINVKFVDSPPIVLQQSDISVVAPGSVTMAFSSAADIDPGDTLSRSIVSQGYHGTVAISADGKNFTYTPSSVYYHGPDQFVYSVNDSHGQKVNMTVNVNITAPNHNPIASDIVININNADQGFNQSLTGSDNDFYNTTSVSAQNGTKDQLTSSMLNGGTFPAGTVLSTPDGKQFVYTSMGSLTPGTFYRYYQVTDDHGGSSIGKITINVTAVDIPPTILTSSVTPYAVRNDSSIVLQAASSVVAGPMYLEVTNAVSDSVIGGVETWTTANGGKIIWNNGSLTYTAMKGFSGLDSVSIDSYILYKGLPEKSPISTLTFDVQPVPTLGSSVNFAPSETINTVQGGAPVILDAFNGGAGTLSISSLTPHAGFFGTVFASNDGVTASYVNGVNAGSKIVYSPGSGATSFGNAEFDLKIVNNLDGIVSNQENYKVNVVPLPITPSKSINVSGASAIFTFGYSDPNAADILQLSYGLDPTTQIALTANHGKVISLSGSYRYVRDPNYLGSTDTLNYSVKAIDPSGLSPESSGVITFNLSPVAVNESFSLIPGQTLTVSMSEGVLSQLTNNPYDPSNETVTLLTSTTTPTGAQILDINHGQLLLNADGSFQYTPNGGFTGDDTFRYMVSVNGTPLSSIGTITFHVYDPVILNDTTITVNANDTAEKVQPVKNPDIQNPIAGLDVDGTTWKADASGVVEGSTTNGTFTYSAGQGFVYKPNAGFTGTEVFAIKAIDKYGVVSTQAASFTANVTDKPTAPDSKIVLAKDTNVISASIAKPSEGAAIYSVKTQPTYGTVVMDPSGKMSYVAKPGAPSQPDTFTYTITDSKGTSSPVTVTIEPSETVTAPVASDTHVQVKSDNTVSGSVFAGAPPATNVKVVSFNDPKNGTVALNSDGTYSYVSTGNPKQGDAFSFYLQDTVTKAVSEIHTVTIKPITSPVAIDHSYQIEANQIIVGSNDPGAQFSSLLSGDSSTNGGVLTASLVRGPLNGSLQFNADGTTNLSASVNADGTFVYVPNTDFTGDDSFVYQVTDSIGNVVSQATVHIHADATYKAPVVKDVVVKIEDGAISASLISLVDKGSKNVANSDITITGLPVNGLATYDSATGKFQYTSNAPGEVVNDSFQFTVRDGITTKIGVINIVADPGKTAPTDIALMDSQGSSSLTLLANTLTSIQDSANYQMNTPNEMIVGYLSATDANPNDILTYEMVNPGVFRIATDGDGKPVVVVNSASSIKSVAPVYANGSDPYSFSIIVTNQEGFSYVKDFHVNVTSVYEQPIIQQNTYEIPENSSLGTSLGLRIINPSGSALTYQIDPSNASAGSLILGNDFTHTGQFTYVSAPNWTGVDHISYTVFDGTTMSEVKSFDVVLTPIDQPVYPQPDTLGGEFGSSSMFLSQNLNYLLNNVGGYAATFDFPDLTLISSTNTLSVYQAPEGKVFFTPDGNITYVPNDPNFTGTDQFNYTATYTNYTGHTFTTDPTPITISITPHLDHAPFYVFLNNGSNGSTIAFIDPLLPAGTEIGTLSGYDPDPGDKLTYSIVSGNDNGAFAIKDNKLVINDSSQFPDSTNPTFFHLSFAATDSYGKSVIDTTDFIYILRFIYKQPIVESGHTFTVAENATEGVSGSVADYASSPVNLNMFFLPTEGPQHGTLIWGAANDGTFTYIPDANYNGSDTFSYLVSDSNSMKYAEMNLDVTPVYVNPTASHLDVSIDQNNSSGIIPLSTLISDINKTVISYDLVNQPLHGTATLDANGNLVYTPNSNFVGVDEITYRISDSGIIVNGETIPGTSAENTIAFTVNHVNQAPVALNDGGFLTGKNQAISGNVLTNDADSDIASFGDTISAVLNANPSHGTVLMNSDGSFSYTPDLNFSGQDTFSYYAVDAAGLKSLANVTIDVVNHAPVADGDLQLSMSQSDGSLNNINLLSGSVVSDPDAQDILTPVIDTSTTFGSLNMNTDGSYNYVPNSGFYGTDTFTFHTVDTSGSVSGEIIGHINVRDNTTISLTSNVPSLVEGGSIIYTATVNNIVEGQPLDILLSNGAHIIIDVGANSGSSDPIAVRSNDVYNEGVIPATVGITSVNGGSFTGLAPTDAINNTTDVIDNFDATRLSLSASDSVLEGGMVRYTATLDSPVDAGSNPLIVSLSNGAVITIEAGQSSGYIDVAARSNDIYAQGDQITAVTIASVGSNNFELLASSPDAAITVVSDNMDITGIIISAPISSPDGSAIIYTATVSDPVTGSDLLITLSNGLDITIPVGQTSGISSPYTLISSNPYDPASVSQNVTIIGATGGSFEALNLASNVTTSITHIDHAPTIAPVGLVFQAIQDSTLAVGIGSSLLNSATDLDLGDAMTAQLLMGPSHGVIALNQDGTFSYAPNTGFYGSDTFTFQVRDIAGLMSGSSAVTINVDGAPVINTPASSVAIVNQPFNLSIGIADPDTAAANLIANVSGLPDGLTASYDQAGHMIITGTPIVSGSFSLVVTAQDEFGAVKASSFNLTVLSPNHAPTNITLSNSSVLEGAANGTVVGKLTGIDPDIGDTLTLTLTNSAGGAFSIDGNNNLVVANSSLLNYQIAPIDTLTVQATDNHGASFSKNISVSMIDVAPTANADNYIANHGLNSPATLIVNALNGVLVNDTDPGAGTALTAQLISGTSHGSLTLNADGSFSYTANAGYSGTDSFTYKANDSTLTSNTATVNLTVNTNPLMGIDNGKVNYVENGSPSLIVKSVTTLVDDAPNFSGGKLTVKIDSGGSASDILSMVNSSNGKVTITGQQIKDNNILVGTFTGGTNGSPLIISFNSNASIAYVADVIKQIGFSINSNNPTTTNRNVSLVLSDQYGGSSDILSKTVSIKSVNDAPDAVVLDNTISVAHNTTTAIGVVGMAGLSVTDADTSSTGTMTVDLAVLAGRLSFTDMTGLSGLVFKQVPGVNGLNRLTFTGTLSEVNLALSKLTYKSNGYGLFGYDLLTIDVQDQSYSTKGGSLRDLNLVLITIQ